MLVSYAGVGVEALGGRVSEPLEGVGPGEGSEGGNERVAGLGGRAKDEAKN